MIARTSHWGSFGNDIHIWIAMFHKRGPEPVLKNYAFKTFCLHVSFNVEADVEQMCCLVISSFQFFKIRFKASNWTSKECMDVELSYQPRVLNDVLP